MRRWEGISPILFLVYESLARGISGRQVVIVDFHAEFARRGQGLNVPVKWERQVDEKTFWCLSLCWPGCLACSSCVEREIFVFQVVFGGQVIVVFHVSYAGYLQDECVTCAVDSLHIYYIREDFLLVYLRTILRHIRERKCIGIGV